MAIRKEQYSTTRYIATLDVIFNEQGMKELLTSLGIPVSEERAPMISILPLVIDGNKGEERQRALAPGLGSISTLPTG